MKLFFPAVLALTLACPLAAQADTMQTYYDRIQIANWHSEIATLQEISKQLQALAVSNNPEAMYAAAYADYRLATTGMKNLPKYRDITNAALDRAENNLKALSEQDTKYQAESLALLSTVYGIKINLSPIKGPILGIKSGIAIAKAEKLAPANPRVLLFKGVGKLYTPPLLGGDREEGIAAINAAIVRFQQTSYNAQNWGLDDAYIWRGIALKSDGHAAEARASFEQALSISPERGWAKHLLAEMGKQ